MDWSCASVWPRTVGVVRAGEVSRGSWTAYGPDVRRTEGLFENKPEPQWTARVGKRRGSGQDRKRSGYEA